MCRRQFANLSEALFCAEWFNVNRKMKQDFHKLIDPLFVNATSALGLNQDVGNLKRPDGSDKGIRACSAPV